MPNFLTQVNEETPVLRFEKDIDNRATPSACDFTFPQRFQELKTEKHTAIKSMEPENSATNRNQLSMGKNLTVETKFGQMQDDNESPMQKQRRMLHKS